MTTDIQTAVENALVTQPWWIRRKDTITAIAGTTAQLLNVAAAYATDAPEWASVVFAVLIGLCQVIIHAGTPGAITPSMGARLEKEAPLDDSGGLAAGTIANNLAGIATMNPDDLDYQPGPSAHESATRGV